MPVQPPTDDFLKAAALRLRERKMAETARQAKIKSRFLRVLWALAALLLIALLADLRNLSQRIAAGPRAQPTPRKGDAADIAKGMGDPRYVDPSGYFSVVPPRHWVKVATPANDFYNVVFRGAHDMDMRVQVVATHGQTFEGLVKKLRQVERNLSADTHMDFAYVGPYRAVKRSVQLFRNRVLLLDFMTGDLAHHVQFSMPPESYEEYEPVFLRLMQTYEPGRILPPIEAPAAP